MNFGVCQPGGPLRNVIHREIESVKHSAARRGNVGVSSAQPRFNVGR
jgi:hypothetical protein